MIRRRRSLGRIFLATIFLAVVYYTSQPVRGSYRYAPAIELSHKSPYQYSQPGDTGFSTVTVEDPEPWLNSTWSSCAWIPDTSNILLVMKTGASESPGKIPVQLRTTLKCLHDFLIFSDLQETIDGVDIYDSLDTVKPEAKDGNPDFDLYRLQQSCAADKETCYEEDIDWAKAAWNLDKYKNVHIAEKTYQMRPNYDWYIFVDADTYVLWPNLVHWLRKSNPSDPHYLGSLSSIAKFPFGHGGSGYIFSQETMMQFVGRHPGVGDACDMIVKETCCGDWMLSVALNQTTDIQVEQMWPTINGEKPHTILYGPDQWCHPIVTMHHLNAKEVSSFWDFERRFYSSNQDNTTSRQPLLIKDIYQKFFAPRLHSKREDWDNLSEDVYYLNPQARKYDDWQLKRRKIGNLFDLEKVAHRSFEDCRYMCEWSGECFQFRFHDGICAISRSFTLGYPREKEKSEDQRWMSGWDVEKIRLWIKMQDDCGEAQWPSVSVD